MNKNCWTELDTDILRSNLLAARRALLAGTKLYFVVKSDAYGHGMQAVAQCAAACGVDGFAVASAGEGIALRSLLPAAEILVLCAPPPETAQDLIEHRLIPLISGFEHGLALAAGLRRPDASRGLDCHVKIDTGMSRLGFDWTRACGEIQELKAHPALRIKGISSHFASAASAAPGLPALQFRRFKKLIDECRAAGTCFQERHISASAGFSENLQWDLDAVRLGILMYGYPVSPLFNRIEVQPPLQWKTRVLQVKTLPRGRDVGYGNTYTVGRRGRFAVLAAGYANGYNRLLSNRGNVLIHGHRCRVAGRVSMNLTTVVLPPDCRVQAGDIAVLMGRQGSQSIYADELAAICGTIPYEILTSIKRS